MCDLTLTVRSIWFAGERLDFGSLRPSSARADLDA